jgi:D-alanyl-lipoteichoic acid acyltransferase DltB (MBOAT superfamily)
MTEEYEDLKRRKNNVNKIATYSLIISMLVMALWGWTPLKEIIPGAFILYLFVLLMLISIASTLLSIYRGIQIRHAEAAIEDS